jgi:membrane protease YdiL (CAAX protease family)
MITFGSFLEEPRSARHPSANGGWGIADAVIVGTVGYAASVLFLLLSMFGAYSIPSVYSRLQFYRLDSGVYVLAGLVGGIAFGGPLVVWYVHRRKLGSLAQSIDWECTNRVLGWACVAGFVAGIVYSVAKTALAGRGYQDASLEAIAAFVVLAGLAAPAMEEIYFRGILFVALARRFGNIPSIAGVTLLFCVAHPQHWFTVLPVAVLLGAMRLYTRSVKACFACHAAYNLSLVLFMLPIIRN